MERFEIVFSKKATKEYRKLPTDYKALIDLALSKLSENMPVDLKPVKGEDNIYRIRVGRYRILFEKIRNIFLITRIGTRGDVYK